MRSDGGDDDPRPGPPSALLVVVPAVVAFVVQVPVAVAAVLWTRPPFPPAALSVALAVVSAAALLATRRWSGPVVAAVSILTLVAILQPSGGPPPIAALGLAIIIAVARGARIWALVSVGVAWTIAIVSAGFQDATQLGPRGGFADAPWHPFRVAGATVALLVCFAIGEMIRARAAVAAARRRQLTERRQAAEQEERTRIARELHDVLAHSLSQIAVQSGVGLHLFDREPEKARDALASIRSLSATGLDEVRGVLSHLRGEERPSAALLTPQPQLADLPALVAARSGLGLAVALDDRTDGDAPRSAVQTTAYRIVQEALTNVVRHSAATTATVRLGREGSDLVVRIADDGTGIPPERAAGGGIRGMRERAELAGGTIDLRTESSGGTEVVARLPWEGPR